MNNKEKYQQPKTESIELETTEGIMSASVTGNSLSDPNGQTNIKTGNGNSTFWGS